MTPAEFSERDGGLSGICGHLLRRAQQVHNALWLDTIGSDPTSPQYAALVAIAATPGLDQRGVAASSSIDTSSTMDVVGRLVRGGWITREVDAADRRRHVLALSPRAIDDLKQLEGGVREVQERLLSPLASPDREEFIELLSTVAGASPAPGALHIPGHLLRRAQQLHTALFAAEFDRQLTGPQFAALQVLAAQPGISQRELSDFAALDKSTAADLVQRLVRRELVVRTRDESDGRLRVLSLAADARGTVVEYGRRVGAVQQRLLAPLGSAQRERFLALLRDVAYAAH
jgi:DNA-binding MarR family transcriptional regulator